MRRTLAFVISGLFFLGAAIAAHAGEKAPQQVVDLANSTSNGRHTPALPTT